MIPVRTRRSNIVYRGPTPDVGDAWVERRRGDDALYLTWKPSREEAEAIAAGSLIRLGVFGSGGRLTPVSLDVDEDGELSPAAIELRDRAIEKLKRVAYGPEAVPAGFWSVSRDVWLELNEQAALDAGDFPTLYGRPLMVLESEDLERYMEFVVPVEAEEERR